MNPSVQVQLVCGGGGGHGYGHVRRTLALADTLRRDGVTVSVSGLNAEIQSLLRGAPASDQAGAARVVVFDAASDLDRPIVEAREAGQTVVALDWFGDEEPDVNVVIYPHRPVRARKSSHVGLQYLLIRDEIASLPRGSDGEGALVVLGGGDLLGQGHAAAQRLAAQGFEVTLVQGPMAPKQEVAGNFQVVRDPPDLPARIAGSALTVTNGGGCMFEAMCLGKACVALPQTAAEEALAQLALAQDALLGIGFGHLHLHADARRREVGRRAAGLVDGQGARRVAHIVEDLL